MTFWDFFKQPRVLKTFVAISVLSPVIFTVDFVIEKGRTEAIMCFDWFLCVVLTAMCSYKLGVLSERVAVHDSAQQPILSKPEKYEAIADFKDDSELPEPIDISIERQELKL